MNPLGANNRKPSPNGLAEKEITRRELMLIYRLRQLRNIGADIIIVQLTGDGPRVRTVGKVEG